MYVYIVIMFVNVKNGVLSLYVLYYVYKVNINWCIDKNEMWVLFQVSCVNCGDVLLLCLLFLIVWSWICCLFSMNG